jgi:SAM-dependent methyltransferase
VTYSQAVAAAPAGAASFLREDLDRLPAGVRARLLEGVPAAERELLEAGDEAAAGRVLRAAFWTLVYNLLPERWDELSRAEPIHPRVLAALPADGLRVLEVGAGSGRLTVNLAARARSLIAVEPVAPLREILRSRVPGIAVLDAVAQQLPVADGWAELAVACASLGPDPACVSELERCTRRGGTIALVSPEDPDWFESNGWRRLRFDPAEVVIRPHDPALEAFFGPLDPPHELLLRAP